MALISCGIRHCLFIVIFSAVLPFGLMADVNIGLAPLPEDPKYKEDYQRTEKALKALLYENHQLYKKANLLWESFPGTSPLISEHSFQTGASLPSFQPSSEPPQSESSFLLMLRYYLWQKRWNQALKLINAYSSVEIGRIDTKLEIIRTYLYFGWYQEAELLMSDLADLSVRDALHLTILKTWLEQLKGDHKEAQRQITELEEDYLYLPLSLLLPGNYEELASEGRLYRQSLIRFPSNLVLLERLILIYQSNDNWEALRDLIESQRHLKKAVFSYDFLANVYLNTDQFKKLKVLNQGRKLRKVTPEFYDYIARGAIREKNWELLQLVATTYQRKFPTLLDGQLYWAIYLSETGQREKAQQFLSEIKVDLSLN